METIISIISKDKKSIFKKGSIINILNENRKAYISHVIIKNDIVDITIHRISKYRVFSLFQILYIKCFKHH